MIDANEIVGMINHWLSTPVNSMFKNSYGADKPSLLLNPMSSNIADAFIAKLRADIPIFGFMGSNDFSVVVKDDGIEQKTIFLLVKDIPIEIGQTNTASGGDSINVRAV